MHASVQLVVYPLKPCTHVVVLHEKQYVAQDRLLNRRRRHRTRRIEKQQWIHVQERYV